MHRGFLCFIVIALLVGCQSDSPPPRQPQDIAIYYREPSAPEQSMPTPASENVTVVTFWTDDNEPERVAVYRDLAEQFMRRNRLIDLRIVPVDESTLAARLESAVAAGDLPDLLRIGSERLAPLAAAGLLNPAAAETVIERVGRDDFLAGPLQMVSDPQSGRPMAVPFDGWIQAVWYRADAFADLDLAPPDGWDVLQSTACALSTEASFEHGIFLPTDPGQNYVHQVFEQVAIANDAWPLDEAGRVAMNSPEMIEALTWYSELQACAAPGAQSAGAALAAYLQGRTGIFFYSTYALDDLAATSGAAGQSGSVVTDLVAKTGFATALEGPATSASYGQVVALAFTNTADPEATRVAEYFLTEGYATVLALDSAGKMPLRHSAIDRWQQSSAALQPYPQETLNQLLQGFDAVDRWFLRPEYTLEQRAIVGDIEGALLIPKAIYAITIEKSLSPAAAAEQLQRQVQALIAARSGATETGPQLILPPR